MTEQEQGGVISNAQLLALPLHGLLTRLVNHSSVPVVLADLRTACERASQDQRDQVYADKALMGKVEQKLSSTQYIAFLGYLRVVEQPSTGVLAEAEGRQGGHTTAKEADAIIQDKMQQYVAEAVKAGKRVSGQVAIVTDADFRKAYLAEFGPSDTDVDRTNAFVRNHDDLIVIHRDRGNAGTTIHEGLHKYSADAVLHRAGFDINEGVTEYFTREICTSLPQPIARGNYQNQFEVITKLAGVVGREVLAQAYFAGKYDGLVQAFVDKGKSEEIWGQFVAAMKAEKFGRALKLLK